MGPLNLVEQMPSKELFKQRFEQYYNIPGVIRGPHAYRSGLTEDYYFDFDNIVCDPVRCELVAKWYISEVKKLSERADYLIFLDKEEGSGTVGAITLAGVISIETGIPYILVRLGKEIPPERVKFPVPTNKKAEALRELSGVLISDHCTFGDELLRAADAIAVVGGHVKNIIVYSYREDKLKQSKFYEEIEPREIRFNGFMPLSEKPPIRPEGVLPKSDS